MVLFAFFPPVVSVKRNLSLILAFMWLFLLTVAAGGQETERNPATSSSSDSKVPRLVLFNGVVKGQTGTVDLTFSIYQEPASTSAVWSETQNVTLDGEGRYSVFLGASRPEGLPLDLLTSGSAHWLVIQSSDGTEQSRIPLTSVPYALVAADAETLGGKPASAYLTVDSVANTSSGLQATSTTAGSVGTGVRSNQSGTACAAVTSSGSGTSNSLAKFTSPCDIENSAITESGGQVGIGNVSPAYPLDVSGTINGSGDLRLSSSSATIYRGNIPFVYAYHPSGSDGYNTFVGNMSGNLTMSPKGGASYLASYNTSLGDSALTSNTTGFANTANGYLALYSNTTGTENTAIGFGAMQLNTTGGVNVAVGYEALQFNTTGIYNTAAGIQALWKNTTGQGNAGYGDEALNHNTTGNYNTCIGGEECLWTNTTGSYNNGLGTQALFFNTTGNYNTGFGNGALYANTSGSDNVALGTFAGNTNTTGSNNIWIGMGSGSGTSTQLSNSIAIGYGTQNTQSNQAIIGNSGITQTLLNGSVGIGTATPAYPLDVNGVIRSQAGGIKFPDGTTQTTAYVGSSQNLVAGNISAGQFGANTGGGNYSFPGNVGIGTTNPANKFEAYGSSPYLFATDVGGRRVGLGVSAGSAETQLISTYIGGNYWPLDIVVGGASRMFFNANGNVGIGTISPAATLSVGPSSQFTVTSTGAAAAASMSLSSPLAVSSGGTGLTGITGLLRGNGSSPFSSAVAGTDYQAPLTVTTSGTTGPAALVGNTLNIPQYAGTASTFSSGLTNTSGTVTNNLITGIAGGQIIVGGTGASDALVLQGTKANGTASATAIQLAVGNAGATPAVSILNSGNVGIGTSAPTDALDVNNTTGTNILAGQYNGANQFRVDNTGTGYFNGGTVTGGADFAESVSVRGQRAQYEPGDVLDVDPGATRHVRLARHAYSTMVAGIYSTKPGVLATPHRTDDPRIGNAEVPLAVVGIVPCKVTAINGSIKPGDLLVTSDVPGYAMKGRDRSRMLGAVVGKALEPLERGSGTIEVLVTLQ